MAPPLNVAHGLEALEFSISAASQAMAAQQSGRQMGLTLGFSTDAAEEIALVIAELTSNLIKHAGCGTLSVRPIGVDERLGLEIEAADQGPGMADVEQAFTDGFSTAGSLGYGLGTINRLMDEVDIQSAADCGTQIVCRRWVRSGQREVSRGAWEVGIVTRPHSGFRANGDAFVVKEWDDHLLVGLIDGLGHGEFAQRASLAAQSYVLRHYDQPLERLFDGVSRACRATRGVVMALAKFQGARKVTFASLGNVEVCARSEPQRLAFLCKRGYLGITECHTKVQEFAWNPHWLLVLHTDGLHTHWQWGDLSAEVQSSPHSVARTLMEKFANGHDDATVLALGSRCT